MSSRPSSFGEKEEHQCRHVLVASVKRGTPMSSRPSSSVNSVVILARVNVLSSPTWLFFIITIVVFRPISICRLLVSSTFHLRCI